MEQSKDYVKHYLHALRCVAYTLNRALRLLVGATKWHICYSANNTQLKLTF